MKHSDGVPTAITRKENEAHVLMAIDNLQAYWRKIENV